METDGLRTPRGPFSMLTSIVLLPGSSAGSVGPEGRSEQLLRIGVPRLPEYPGGGPGLDDLPALHDRQLVAEGLEHLEVVADEDVAQAVLGLELLQELDDLELDCPVER